MSRAWPLLVVMFLLTACGQDPAEVSIATVAPVTTTPVAGTATPVEVALDETAAATVPPTAAAAPGMVTLAAVGDVMMDRSIGRAVLSDGATVVFEGVEDVLHSADITFANVESAISSDGTPASKGYTFRAPPETVGALTDAGIDVVALANNHALDYGPEALVDTRERLEAAGVGVAGAGRTEDAARTPAFIERAGLTFAFLAYVDTAAEGSYNQANWNATVDSPGVAWASVEEIVADVKAATTIADIVVVSLHVGIEYSTTPSDLQRQYAQAAIDAGAKLVLGHHAHVLQPVEEYGGGLIAYSLGNFVFDGFDGESNSTAILRVTFKDTEIAGWELVPATIVGGFPVLD